MLRNLKEFSIFLCLLSVLISCQNVDLLEADTSKSEPDLEKEAYVLGETLIKINDSIVEEVELDLKNSSLPTKSSSFGAITAELGIVKMERLFPHAGKFEARTRKSGLHKWYKVTYDPSISRTKAQGSFNAMPGIDIVEDVKVIKSTGVFNDPQLFSQWHYYNDGSITSKHKAGADINVQEVWKKYTTGSEEVIVAVVDGGIDQNHEDLKASCIGGKNFVTNTSAITPDDHGTHVGGTIGAINNNGIGVSGIAGGDAKAGVKGVKLLSCQIFDGDLGASGAAAIKYGADHGAVISQNSWGIDYEKAGGYEVAKNDRISPSQKDAIDYFIKYAGMDENGKQVGPMEGGIVVFAAGNDNWDVNPLSAYEPVIAVGAYSPDYTRAYYSNYGDWVDLAAPGGSYDYSQGLVVSTIPNNGYGGMQGTSMACPHVSGIAALLVSYYGGPGFTNDMLKEMLINSAKKNPNSSASSIGPMVDALAAISYGRSEPPKKVTSAEVEVKSNTFSLTWAVTSDPDDIKAFGYVILATKDKSLLEDENLKVNSLPSGISSVKIEVGELEIGDEINGVIGELDFETDYFVTVVAYDYGRNYSDISPIYAAKTGVNTPPVISTDYKGDYKIRAHEVLDIPFVISDEKGHDPKIIFDAGSKAIEYKLSPSGEYIFTFTGNKADPGKYKAVITATDKYKAVTKYEINYEIMENQAPVMVKPIEDIILGDAGAKLQLNIGDYIQDPDGEVLKFSFSISNKLILHVNHAEGVLHFTALDYGVVDVKVTGQDAKGKSCVFTFKVLVQNPADTSIKLYPNPVVDILNIKTSGSEVEAKISVLNAGGTLVYQGSDKMSVFVPAKVDMSKSAPGVYTVKVEIDGKTYNRNVVKL